MTSPIFRVSHLEQFRRWLADDDMDLDTLLARLRGEEEPSDRMLIGTAGHRALELAEYGEVDYLEAEGVTLTIDCDAVIELPMVRELRASKDYGGIIVTGCVDAIDGLTVYDHKFTAQFDAELYLESYQHRFYMDIFGADWFVWNVLVRYNNSIKAVHRLEQCRYPAMHDDCMKLAQQFRMFAEIHMPERFT